MQERSLIRRLKQHQPQALEELITTYSPYVGTIIRNIIGKYLAEPDVEELTADVFLAVWEHTDQLKGALKTKVETNREMITFSKFLATIKTDVPIQLDMNSLVREEPNEEELRKIFEELEFRTLIDRVLKKGSGNSSSPTPTSPVPDLFAGTLFAPAANLHSPKTAPRFKAICLQILRARGRAFLKIQI